MVMMDIEMDTGTDRPGENNSGCSNYMVHSKKVIKHALRQQAKRRRKNTTIASGNSRSLPQIVVKPLAPPPAPPPGPPVGMGNDTAANMQINNTIEEPAATMREVLASLPGFSLKSSRRRSTKKLSAAAQLEAGLVDLESPASILSSTSLRALLNRHTFQGLPPLYQRKLAQLLPSVDRQDAATSGLNNEFFARACLEWRKRLAEGEFTPENQQRLKMEAEKDKNKLDPWKLKHFEPIWGDKREPRLRSSHHNITETRVPAHGGAVTRSSLRLRLEPPQDYSSIQTIPSIPSPTPKLIYPTRQNIHPDKTETETETEVEAEPEVDVGETHEDTEEHEEPISIDPVVEVIKDDEPVILEEILNLEEPQVLGREASEMIDEEPEPEPEIVTEEPELEPEDDPEEQTEVDGESYDVSQIQEEHSRDSPEIHEPMDIELDASETLSSEEDTLQADDDTPSREIMAGPGDDISRVEFPVQEVFAPSSPHLGLSPIKQTAPQSPLIADCLSLPLDVTEIALHPSKQYEEPFPSPKAEKMFDITECENATAVESICEVKTPVLIIEEDEMHVTMDQRATNQIPGMDPVTDTVPMPEGMEIDSETLQRIHELEVRGEMREAYEEISGCTEEIIYPILEGMEMGSNGSEDTSPRTTIDPEEIRESDMTESNDDEELRDANNYVCSEMLDCWSVEPPSQVSTSMTSIGTSMESPPQDIQDIQVPWPLVAAALDGSVAANITVTTQEECGETATTTDSTTNVNPPQISGPTTQVMVHPAPQFVTENLPKTTEVIPHPQFVNESLSRANEITTSQGQPPPQFVTEILARANEGPPPPQFVNESLPRTNEGHPPPQFVSESLPRVAEGHPPPQFVSESLLRINEGHPTPQFVNESLLRLNEGHPPPQFVNESLLRVTEGHPTPQFVSDSLPRITEGHPLPQFVSESLLRLNEGHAIPQFVSESLSTTNEVHPPPQFVNETILRVNEVTAPPQFVNETLLRANELTSPQTHVSPQFVGEVMSMPVTTAFPETMTLAPATSCLLKNVQSPPIIAFPPLQSIRFVPRFHQNVSPRVQANVRINPTNGRGPGVLPQSAIVVQQPAISTIPAIPAISAIPTIPAIPTMPAIPVSIPAVSQNRQIMGNVQPQYTSPSVNPRARTGGQASYRGSRSSAKGEGGRSRGSTKEPPGAVNLERSYQICQAVIQSSPNRDQLKAHLKPPPSLLARGDGTFTTNKSGGRTITTVKSQKQAIHNKNPNKQTVMLRQVFAARQQPVEMLEAAPTVGQLGPVAANGSPNFGQYILVQRTGVSDGAPRASSAPPLPHQIAGLGVGVHLVRGRPASAGEGSHQAVTLKARGVTDGRGGGAETSPGIIMGGDPPPPCECHMRGAMVICRQCGAFCHDDCMGPQRICATCLIR